MFNKTILIASLMLTHFLHANPKDTGYIPLKEEIFYNLHVLNNYQAFDGEYQEVDPWALAEKTSRQLARLLKFPQSRELDSVRSKDLALSVSTNDSTQVRIYLFGFHCGGTRGWVDYSVMQWQSREGQLLSYDLSQIANMHFTEIYPLRTDSVSSLYLLLGNERDNATSAVQTAMVFRFQGPYFLINHKAFADEYGIITSNTAVTYDPNRKTLHLQSLMPGFDFSRIDPDKPDSIADQKLSLLLSENYDPHYGVDLQWNGTRFVNKNPARKAGE